MVRGLNFEIEIVPCPTVREDDGLALSSRNAYLTPEERAIAPKLHQALEAIRDGADIELAKTHLQSAGFGQIDYIALRDADTLGEITPETTSRRLLAALWLGKTRLIDNIAV